MSPVSYAVEEAEPHRMVVSLPRLTVEDSGTLVEVVFQAQVLRHGSTFAAQVWDSVQPLEVPQSVQEGDASPAYEGNRVWVATTARKQAVLQVRGASAILTPNGDGRNDVVGLGYDLLELTGRASVGVAVWDLLGRRVRQVYAGRDGVGAYERIWDGRDASGRLGATGTLLILCIRQGRSPNGWASRTPTRGVLSNFSFALGPSYERPIPFINLLALFLWIGFATGEASGLVIYRFGGEALEPPPEASNEGVEFIQLNWTDLDPSLGGETVDLDIDAAIRALKRDPTFNIAPGIEEKGGSHVRPNVNGQVWDGDESTVWLADRYLCAEFEAYNLVCIDDFGTPGTTNISLGGRYLIDRIRVKSGLDDPGKIVGSLRVFMSPLFPTMRITFNPPPFAPWIVEVRDNRAQILDIPIPPHEQVEFVQVTVGEHNEDWEVHEIEIYAKGFVEQATYISNILDFGQPMAWGDLRWSGHQDPKARVLIQSRSGQDDDPNLFWRFTGRGDEKTPVSRTAYAKLARGEKAGIGYDQDNLDVLVGSLRLCRQQRHSHRVAESTPLPPTQGGHSPPRRRQWTNGFSRSARVPTGGHAVGRRGLAGRSNGRTAAAVYLCAATHHWS